MFQWFFISHFDSVTNLHSTTKFSLAKKQTNLFNYSTTKCFVIRRTLLSVHTDFEQQCTAFDWARVSKRASIVMNCEVFTDCSWKNKCLQFNYKVFCDKDTFECTYWFWTVYSVWLSPSEQASEQSFELWSLYRQCMYTLEL